jgi:hypothetical protein
MLTLPQNSRFVNDPLTDNSEIAQKKLSNKLHNLYNLSTRRELYCLDNNYIELCKPNETINDQKLNFNRLLLSDSLLNFDNHLEIEININIRIYDMDLFIYKKINNNNSKYNLEIPIILIKDSIEGKAITPKKIKYYIFINNEKYIIYFQVIKSLLFECLLINPVKISLYIFKTKIKYRKYNIIIKCYTIYFYSLVLIYKNKRIIYINEGIIPKFRYLSFVYLYAISLCYYNNLSYREAAEMTKKHYCLSSFSHTTIHRNYFKFLKYFKFSDKNSGYIERNCEGENEEKFESKEVKPEVCSLGLESKDADAEPEACRLGLESKDAEAEPEPEPEACRFGLESTDAEAKGCSVYSDGGDKATILQWPGLNDPPGNFASISTKFLRTWRLKFGQIFFHFDPNVEQFWEYTPT